MYMFSRNLCHNRKHNTSTKADIEAARHKLQEQQRIEVKRLVGLGVLERTAHSLWNSPQLLVEKKALPDGKGGMRPPKWRVIADFRKVNESLSFSESYPLPHIPSVLASLSGCRYYSATDATHGCTPHSPPPGSDAGPEPPISSAAARPPS
mgnify:CR=1 FL=1